MKMFVGLGNPGPKYAGNRHNIGFLAVERIAQAHGFGPWKSKFKALASEGTLGRQKVMLLKPQTYMNESGQSVGEAARFLKIAPHDIIVFHDELDLAPGKVKVKQGGSNAGHNGLRSIDAHVGNETFRVRLGIGHPGSKDAVVHYVLADFFKADDVWLPDLLDHIAAAAPHLATGDTARFLNDVARSRTASDTHAAPTAHAPPAQGGRRSPAGDTDNPPSAPARSRPASGGPPGERQSKRAGALAENLAKWLSARKTNPRDDSGKS